MLPENKYVRFSESRNASLFSENATCLFSDFRTLLFSGYNLGRYTHKIAISNHRIKDIENNTVSFTAKDYRKGGAKKMITMDDHEFIRRFCLHILPKGFTRIWHYGILSSSLKKESLTLLQQELGKPEIRSDAPAKNLTCLTCKTGILITITQFKSRGPPLEFILNSASFIDRFKLPA